jgi:hypothetical protein
MELSLIVIVVVVTALAFDFTNDPAGQIVGLVRRVVIVLSVLGLHDLPAVGSSLTPRPWEGAC